MLNKSSVCEVSRRRLFGATCVSVIATLCAGGTASAQNPFHEPPVFASQNGTLDILMTAKQKPIPTINFTSPTTGKRVPVQGWAYEICKRSSSGQTSCPTGPGTVWDYGGIRLALQQGDTLKIHFSNQLPFVDPNKYLHSADEPNIKFNPTNLHTHGLLTPA